MWQNVFRAHGVDANDNVVLNNPLHRSQVLPFFAKLAPCLIGMEACALLDHLQGVESGKLKLAPDFWDNLAAADAHEAAFVKSVDDYIAKTGIVASEEALPALRDGFRTPLITKLDLELTDLTNIICLRLLAREAAGAGQRRFPHSERRRHLLSWSLLCRSALASDGEVQRAVHRQEYRGSQP
jgi:hypothetical protein